MSPRGLLLGALLVVSGCASAGGLGPGDRFPVYLRGEDVPCDYHVWLDLREGYVLQTPTRPFRRPVRESEARYQLARWLSRVFTAEMPDRERPDAVIDVEWLFEREYQADGRAGDPSLVVGYMGTFVEFSPQACADEARRGG